MKKRSFILLCCLSVSIMGCNLKRNEELFNTNSLLLEENAQLKNEVNELQKNISSIEKENEDLKTKLKEFVVDLDDTKAYEVHQLNTSLYFINDGYNTKVFLTPKISKHIYIIQKGDIVDVNSVVHVKQNNKNFIKVKISNGLEGYIQIGDNPYQNGNFEVVDTLVVNEAEIKILKMEKKFEVDEGINMKELPSKNSNNIHEITHEEGYEYHKSLLITSDYNWVKMQIGDFVGWVSSENLGVGRGGPVLNTPEEYIQFNLIDGNEI